VRAPATARDRLDFGIFQEAGKFRSWLRADMSTSDEDERARLRFKMRVTVAVTFAVGLAAVLLARSCSIPWLQEALKELGVAFMIAATLAATVDVALKNELIRDVFFATFRYAFPPQLQTEILRIAAYRLICEKHVWGVKIETIDAETVRVTSDVRRRIKNIGSFSIKIGPDVHIDDWGFPQEKAKIMECVAAFEDGQTITATRRDSSPSTIHFRGRKISLEPGKYVMMTSRWSEIRRHNDSVYVSFSCPTLDPEIEVNPPAGYSVARTFGSASERSEEIFTGRVVVSGTYLPFHFMIVRWWPDPERS
jgi:hypothetical protein